ncbi:phage/plasmid replication protein, II/X family [Acinetobacter sp. ANC 3832]|uniref:phage/plasmid replication protein, II/X family n=1 Tax=Acinetobacter sp. ANC 3832 TaxID=1977874 RepID=UPI001D172225|nr:phage/plasmid replication protein, II/X family [Acinetobacter sp. ANC 3832]
MYKNKINIDWLDVVVDVTHDPKKLSKGLTIYLDENHDFGKAQKSYSPLYIESNNKHVLKVKSVDDRLKISGNFYKWLNGQNITGCASIDDLVLDVVKRFIEMGLIEPTDEQLDIIKKGQYRIYQTHIKQDLIFDNKQLALNYLDQLKKGGYYPYKPKTIYQNGVYFGQSSKRWVLGYYHKGKEIDQKRIKKDIVNPELKALADVMIRAEIKIYYRQLKDWDLMFAWKWHDVDHLDIFFKIHLKKLKIPNFNYVIEPLKIKQIGSFIIACYVGILIFYMDGQQSIVKE